MPEYKPVLLKADRHQELLQFLSRAFERPADHPWFIPSIRKPDLPEAFQGRHYGIIEEGRIVAAAGLFPITWRLGKQTLRIACVGNVSVDPARRGHGLMGAILNHLIELIREAKYPLAGLGGQRQRYQYFGWERAGSWSVFSVTAGNLKHAEVLAAGPKVILELAREEPDVVDALVRLHAAQNVRCDRPAELCIPWLSRRKYRPVVARNVAGDIVGYAVVNDVGGCVEELVARDTALAAGLARALLEKHEGKVLKFRFEPTQPALLSAFGDFAETAELQSGGNWRVLDWVTVIGTLLRFRHEMNPLPEGQTLVHVRDYGTIRLFVERDRAGCEALPLRGDWEVDPARLTRLLFGPLPPWMAMPLPVEARILNAWCPLPLATPMQDRF